MLLLGEDLPGWDVLSWLPLDSFPVDALGLTSPSPGGFSRGALASGPNANCGMGMRGQEKPRRPPQHFIAEG